MQNSRKSYQKTDFFWIYLLLLLTSQCPKIEKFKVSRDHNWRETANNGVKVPNLTDNYKIVETRFSRPRWSSSSGRSEREEATAVHSADAGWLVFDGADIEEY